MYGSNEPFDLSHDAECSRMMLILIIRNNANSL